jgi:hypothetical protein
VPEWIFFLLLKIIIHSVVGKELMILIFDFTVVKSILCESFKMLGLLLP